MIDSSIANKKLLWVQSLRGVAALMVLCFHLAPHWENTFPLSFIVPAMKWGFSGVDIFFILSGFVVYKTAREAILKNDLLRFIKHRLFRIYLGYWPILIMFALGSVIILKQPLPDAKKIIFSTFLLYPNIWDNWLTPAWSLSFELIFYVSIILIILSNQVKTRITITYVILFLSAWNVGWIVLDRDLIFMGLQPIRYVFNAFGIEFLAGALIFELYDSKTKSKSQAVALPAPPIALSMILIGFSIASISPLFNDIEILRVGALGVAGAGFLFLFLFFEDSKKSPPTWLVAIGNASYSLYLLHTFLLELFASGRNHFLHLFTTEWSQILSLIAIPVLIVLISIAWYQRVERPFLKWAIRKF